jgi:hypothetical protein
MSQIEMSKQELELMAMLLVDYRKNIQTETSKALLDKVTGIWLGLEIASLKEKEMSHYDD